ncbi:hypothetical protein DSM3645_18351 [Blastopirellula marina DSM 3645]|uniref:Uncharacterized protein n=1 Tax=Blastopirellula marina DSM 3645 TaxID=314230 RepID=A3ZYW4_9BACT|nr:hypothetical protein DSM3645_18351 [Blastopirellula marina DSM 3645]
MCRFSQVAQRSEDDGPVVKADASAPGSSPGIPREKNLLPAHYANPATSN